jgi:DNA-binding MarR family transcriptional regulator
MAGRRDDTIRRILDLEERVHRSVGWGDPETWIGADLGTSQVKVLFLLRASDAMRIGAIGRALQVQKASVSETVDRLEAQGLVAREPDPDDRRSVRVRLTSSGRELSDRLRSAGSVRTARLLAVMDDVELDSVRLGLEAMGRAAARLQAEDGEGGPGPDGEAP